MKKKNLATTALAVVMAVTLLVGGGTFAYLQSSSSDVINKFKTNKVAVELTETTGADYDIVPGTSQAKDPKVTVDNTVDAYVFVKVTDKTNGLVSWAPEAGWTELAGYTAPLNTKVFYRVVKKGDVNKSFYFLKDNQVAYAPTIENSDMITADGNLKTGFDLTFKASAIQMTGFDTPLAAYTQTPNQVSTTEEMKSALKEGKPVTLTKDVAIDGMYLTKSNATTIDLNNKTLTVNCAYAPTALSGKELKFENGNINAVGGRYTAFAINKNAKDASITFNNVTADFGDKSILINSGAQNAKVNIINSTITTKDNYGISTNASTGGTQNNTINIENSKIIVDNASGDSTGILFNTHGTMNIVNSEIKADRQAVINRCGTLNIENSKLTITGKYPDKNKHTNANWGSGNEVPMACVVVGNRTAAAYDFDATLNVKGATFTTVDGVPEVYAAACNGHTTTIKGFVVSGANYVEYCATGSTIIK